MIYFDYDDKWVESARSMYSRKPSNEPLTCLEVCVNQAWGCMEAAKIIEGYQDAILSPLVERCKELLLERGIEIPSK